MTLILPIFDLALTTDQFTIVLYQFDGVSIVFKRNPEYWMKRISEVVEDKAKELDIITRLEWSRNGAFQ
jgi:hypothetical protein